MKYTIIIGDSRNMDKVGSGSVRLVVTSPPYWGLFQYSENPDDISTLREHSDFFRELGKVWKECYRVLQPGGILVVNFQDLGVGSKAYGYTREICLVGDMVKTVEDSGLFLWSRWIWYKSKSGRAVTDNKAFVYANLENTEPKSLFNWEYLFAFRKSAIIPETRKPRFSRDRWIELQDGVWYVEASESGRYSDVISGGAVFPVEIPKRFIEMYTQPGELVLDPFGGTGTTMLAAFRMGNPCIIYEVRKEMLPIIKAKVGYGKQVLFGDPVEWEVI